MTARTVQAYDPQAERTARQIFGNRISLVGRAYEALKSVDALVIITEWNEFREPDFGRMAKLMRSPVIFDGRNLFSVEQMRALGFEYFSMGR